ncbi:MAG: hypothetical protein JSW00_04005 [Thermoplasmata archaeon]|nr:MAG: hypothetical protein JSW00_04005 [Thermoplasmata archaeon]
MIEPKELMLAQEELSEKEQLFAIALAQSEGDVAYSATAANIDNEIEAKEILNKASFQKAVAALSKTEMQNTYYTRLVNFNFKAAKLYEMIELVSTDPQKAKELRYTPTHMLKAIELLNSMQGHNAPEQKVMMNYNAGDAMQPMKNVTPSSEEESQTKALIIEYEKEY